MACLLGNWLETMGFVYTIGSGENQRPWPKAYFNPLVAPFAQILNYFTVAISQPVDIDASHNWPRKCQSWSQTLSLVGRARSVPQLGHITLTEFIVQSCTAQQVKQKGKEAVRYSKGYTKVCAEKRGQKITLSLEPRVLENIFPFSFR